VYGDEEARAASIAAMTDAAPWLRRRLGERLKLRHVPELTVKRDDSIEEGDRILRLLRQIDEERGS
jgi:ribosome-binding factor A